MSRKPTERVTLTLRLTEALRASLERSAKIQDLSLNNEINRRLERSLEREETMADAFGGPGNAALAQMIGAATLLIEQVTKKSWRCDHHTREQVKRAVTDLIDMMAPLPTPPRSGKEALAHALLGLRSEPLGTLVAETLVKHMGSPPSQDLGLYGMGRTAQKNEKER